MCGRRDLMEKPRVGILLRSQPLASMASRHVTQWFQMTPAPSVSHLLLPGLPSQDMSSFGVPHPAIDLKKTDRSGTNTSKTVNQTSVVAVHTAHWMHESHILSWKQVSTSSSSSSSSSKDTESLW